MFYISMPITLWHSLLKVVSSVGFPSSGLSINLWSDFKDNPDELVEVHSKALHIGNYSKYTWYYDQIILSRIILQSGLCTVPKYNKMWKTTFLNPPEEKVDDSKTCFHGFNVSNTFSFKKFSE